MHTRRGTLPRRNAQPFVPLLLVAFPRLGPLRHHVEESDRLWIVIAELVFGELLHPEEGPLFLVELSFLLGNELTDLLDI